MIRALDTVPPDIARDVELAEALGWEDFVHAAPDWFSDKHSMATWRLDGAVGFRFDDPPNPLFNRVIGLGVLGPATGEALDEAIDAWVGTGRTFVIHASVDNASAPLTPLLQARGLQRSRNWAKFVRGPEPSPVAPSDIRVEEVDLEYAATFAQLAAGMAGLPDIVPLIGATVGRAGWHSYVALDGDTPVYVGQLFVADGLGWLFNGEHGEVERPDAQHAIIARRVADALSLGCRRLVAESGEQTADAPNAGYQALLHAGFQIAYLRRNWLGTASTS